MDVFFLLVFLAFLFVMVIGGVLYWAVMAGQFEDSDKNGRSILLDKDVENEASAPDASPAVSRPSASDPSGS